MKFDLEKFLVKYEKFVPLALFLLFVAVTVPGISWGAPSLWNPDELFWRVNMALGGEMKFDETEPDYNYPHYPNTLCMGLGGWLKEQVALRQISWFLPGLFRFYWVG